MAAVANRWTIDASVDPNRPVVTLRWSAWHDSPPEIGDLVVFRRGITGTVALVDNDQVTVALVAAPPVGQPNPAHEPGTLPVTVLDVGDTDALTHARLLLGPAADGVRTGVTTTAGVCVWGTVTHALADGESGRIELLVVETDDGRSHRIPWAHVVDLDTTPWEHTP